MSSHFWPQLAAAAVGIGPALAVMFLSLRRYDRPHFDHTLFDDRRIFFALAVGLVVGTVTTVAGAFVSVPGGGLASGFVIGLLLAIVEEMFKLVYLNRPGYRARFDTVFTGLALGCGMAASGGFASAYLSRESLGDPAIGGFVVVFAVSLAGLHAFTGSLIGFGCAFGRTFQRLAAVIAVRGAYIALAIPFATSSSLPAVIFLGLTLGLALFLLYWTLRHTLPDAVPPSVWRQRRRKVRSRPGVR